MTDANLLFKPVDPRFLTDRSAISVNTPTMHIPSFQRTVTHTDKNFYTENTPLTSKSKKFYLRRYANPRSHYITFGVYGAFSLVPTVLILWALWVTPIAQDNAMTILAIYTIAIFILKWGYKESLLYDLAFKEREPIRRVLKLFCNWVMFLLIALVLTFKTLYIFNAFGDYPGPCSKEVSGHTHAWYLNLFLVILPVSISEIMDLSLAYYFWVYNTLCDSLLQIFSWRRTCFIYLFFSLFVTCLFGAIFSQSPFCEAGTMESLLIFSLFTIDVKRDISKNIAGAVFMKREVIDDPMWYAGKLAQLDMLLQIDMGVLVSIMLIFNTLAQIYRINVQPAFPAITAVVAVFEGFYVLLVFRNFLNDSKLLVEDFNEFSSGSEGDEV